MSDERPINRRRFFREGLGELLRPLLASIEPIHDMAEKISRIDSPSSPDAPATVRKPGTSLPVYGRWLRPPGALPEGDFLTTCSRCGECVKACPVQCIQLDPRKSAAEGAPYILPDDAPCVVCQGLECMNVCPTGALVPTLMADIDMGTARWNASLCLRSSGDGCKICVEMCPLGSAAIVLDEEKVWVIEDGCIGCGVCQHQCPTDPKSIFVIPKAART